MQFCFIFPGLNLPFVFIGSQSSFRSIYHKEATILVLSENYWLQEECNKADLPYRCQLPAEWFLPGKLEELVLSLDLRSAVLLF